MITRAFKNQKGCHPSGLVPGHTPALTPDKEQAVPILGVSEQGNVLFVLAPRCCCRSPSKALPENKKDGGNWRRVLKDHVKETWWVINYHHHHHYYGKSHITGSLPF